MFRVVGDATCSRNRHSSRRLRPHLRYRRFPAGGRCYGVPSGRTRPLIRAAVAQLRNAIRPRPARHRALRGLDLRCRKARLRNLDRQPAARLRPDRVAVEDEPRSFWRSPLRSSFRSRLSSERLRLASRYPSRFRAPGLDAEPRLAAVVRRRHRPDRSLLFRLAAPPGRLAQPLTRALVLPIATLVLGWMPFTARMVRVGVVQALDSEYVQMARLKGLPETDVVRTHVLPNALVPAIQAFALTAAGMPAGIVIVEYLFGFQGIGSLPDSIPSRSRDALDCRGHHADSRRRVHRCEPALGHLHDPPDTPAANTGRRDESA